MRRSRTKPSEKKRILHGRILALRIRLKPLRLPSGTIFFSVHIPGTTFLYSGFCYGLLWQPVLYDVIVPRPVIF